MRTRETRHHSSRPRRAVWLVVQASVRLWVATSVACSASPATTATKARTTTTDASPATIAPEAGSATDSSPPSTGSDAGGGASDAIPPGSGPEGGGDASVVEGGTSNEGGTVDNRAACSFYVAANGGNDSNAGTSAAPFATLSHLQSVVSAAPSSSKVACLKAGTYATTVTLALSSADNGETWETDPASAVNTAVLDGGGNGTFGSNTGVDIFHLVGTSNVTINGLKLQNFYQYGAELCGGPNSDCGSVPDANGNTFENMDCGYNTWVSGGDTHNACVMGTGVITNTTIANNYFHDLVGGAAELVPYFSGDTADGSVWKNNVILRTNQAVAYDEPAMGTDGHGGYQNVTGLLFENNFIRDWGAAGIGGVAAIYLDDNSNLVTVKGNIIGPPNPAGPNSNATRPDYEAIEVHDGANNTITGNILDLGTSAAVYEVNWFQDSSSFHGMAGNTFTDNVVIMNFMGDSTTENFGNGYAFGQAGTSIGSDFTIQNNMYFNYGGGQVDTSGLQTSDSNPSVSNPSFVGSTGSGNITYQLAGSSSAFSSPVSLPPIVSGWGPPGFVIPSGEGPSYPH
jgi:hypothetical protein